MPVVAAGAVGERGAVRVVVADPVPLFRRGVTAVLDATPDLAVVGEVGDADGLAAVLASGRPHVALVDAWLDGHGIDACAHATRSGVRVIVVASPATPPDLAAVVSAGATGYLAREAGPEELVEAVRTAAAGQALLSPEVASRLLDEFATLVRRADGTDPGGPHLTGRELEVLRLVAQGLNNRAIAERLYISENTVKNHVRNIHEKLQVHSRMEAVVRAVREGLLEIA